MNRKAFVRTLSAVAVVASTLLLGPIGASASGPETASCPTGSSAPGPTTYSSSTVVCTGAPDDSGPYNFTYTPALDCKATTLTPFVVLATSGELSLPGVGSYVVSTPGPRIVASFTYLAIDIADPVPPIEAHQIDLVIICPTGATAATLVE